MTALGDLLDLLTLLRDRALRLVPFYLFVWSAVTAWTVIGDLCVLGIFVPLLNDSRFGETEWYPPAELAKGTFIMVLFVALKATWVGAWVFARRLDSHYRERSPRGKPIMQCSEDSIQRMFSGQSVNHRFRTCGKCDSSLPLGDRVYHCSEKNVHYPVYDHYCFWLHLTVFLHTIKPYLFLCAALTADALFVFGVSVYAAATTPSTRQHVGAAFASFLVFMSLSYDTTFTQWYILAFRNCPGAEEIQESFPMIRRLEGRELQIIDLPVPNKGPHSPWELRWSQNLRETLGDSVWSWFFFWVIPGRVRRWEADSGEDSDFPLGPLWHDFVEGRTPLGPNHIREWACPVVIDQPNVEERVPTSLPTSWISRRRGARSTAVDIEMV